MYKLVKIRFLASLLLLGLYFTASQANAQTCQNVSRNVAYVLKVDIGPGLYENNINDIEQLRSHVIHWLSESIQCCLAPSTLPLNEEISEALVTLIRRLNEGESLTDIEKAEQEILYNYLRDSADVDFIIYLGVHRAAGGSRRVILDTKLISVDLPGVFVAGSSTTLVDEYPLIGDNAPATLHALIDSLVRNWQQRTEKLCYPRPIDPILELGIGGGMRSGNDVALSNIPIELRTLAPHPEDQNLPLLEDPNPFIPENTALIGLPYRNSLNAFIRVLGVFNIAARYSLMETSEIILEANLFRNEYLPGDPEGSALIYYSVRSTKKSLFSRNSLSIPLYLTYPISNLGKNQEYGLRFLVGTTTLFPERSTFLGEKGWDRFNARTSCVELENELNTDCVFELGEMKEIEWFGGFELTRTFAQSNQLSAQFTLEIPNYKFESTAPFALDIDDSGGLSFRFDLAYTFGISSRRYRSR